MPNSTLKSVEFENHEDLKKRKTRQFSTKMKKFLPQFSDVQRQRRRIARRTVTQSWRLKKRSNQGEVKTNFVLRRRYR